MVNLIIPLSIFSDGVDYNELKEEQMDIKKNLPYIAIIIIVIASTTFAVFKFVLPANSKSQDSSEIADNGSMGSYNGSTGGQNGRTGRGGQRGNFQRLHGTITSISSQTINMTADDKSTKTLTCDDNTRISTQENGQMTQLTLSELKPGDEINVMGDDTSSSNITPRMIIVGTFTAPQNGGGSWQRPSSGSDSSGVDNTQPSDSSSSTSQI